MKTNFRPRNNTGGTSGKRVGLVIGTLALAALALFVLRSPIATGAASFWKASQSVSKEARNLLSLITSKESLIKENATLKDELISYNALALNYRALQASENTLLQTFGRTNTQGETMASVLVHPPETPYDVLIIDAGSAEGVKAGERVALPEGGLLGNILQVSPHSSRVVLYTGSGISTDALLERGNVPVTLQGRGGGTFEAEVPKDILVVAGDRVLAPSITAPLLGVVEDVSSLPTDSTQHVLVRSVANFSTIRSVSLLP